MSYQPDFDNSIFHTEPHEPQAQPEPLAEHMTLNLPHTTEKVWCAWRSYGVFEVQRENGTHITFTAEESRVIAKYMKKVETE